MWRGGRKGLLPDQAKRYAKRTATVLGEQKSITRAITQADLDAILMDDQERILLIDGFDDAVVQSSLKNAYTLTAKRFKLDLAWDSTTSPADLIIGDMIKNVQDTTKARVASVIRSGIDSGASTSEIQRALLGDSSFGPARALRIARTETAKVATEGTNAAYLDAASEGVSFKVEWVTARDKVVRPSHLIDGQKVDPGEDFTLADGARGVGPGKFASAANVVNCRCGTRPVKIRRPK